MSEGRVPGGVEPTGLMRRSVIGRVLGGFGIGLAILVVIAAVYAFTFAPGHASNLRAESADGASSHHLTSAHDANFEVSVTPEAQWRVQPLVQKWQVPLLKDLPKPPLPNDPRLVWGQHTGLLITSPDGAFAVELRAEPDAAEANAELEGLAAGTELLHETLASGAEVRHFSTDDAVHGVVELGDIAVPFTATLQSSGSGSGSGSGDGSADNGGNTGGSGEDRNRAAQADYTLADFRPALSALLESLASP